MIDLERLVTLSNSMTEKERKVEELEEELRRAKQDLRDVQEEQIPDIMMELGVTDVTLSDGRKLTIKEDLHCKIADKNRKEAHDWMIENGFGDIIKNQVVVNVETGNQEALNSLLGVLSSNQYEDYSLKNNIHFQTLKKFVKENIEAGVDIPLNLFGVFMSKKAQIK
jgi:hypothetical protein